MGEGNAITWWNTIIWKFDEIVDKLLATFDFRLKTFDYGRVQFKSSHIACCNNTPSDSEDISSPSPLERVGVRPKCEELNCTPTDFRPFYF